MPVYEVLYEESRIIFPIKHDPYRLAWRVYLDATDLESARARAKEDPFFGDPDKFRVARVREFTPEL